MPGWIIQGVRGEGKTLCAVAKAKEYLSRGCPVATNLDLFLENLVPDDNQTLAYRLPDHPRYEDLCLLPAAYDPNYKAEDKNGLIILDELALWMNTRQWKQKGRGDLITWLLLSRKFHWDLILLCQDHAIIDKQVKTTCCDYLVQASRTDRKRIPFIAPVLEFFFMSSTMPKWHIYDVYYGLDHTDVRVDRWQFSGKDIYDGYDTNQRFTDGNEVMGKTLVDMRATSTYLPAAYLTKQIYVDRLQDQINSIINIQPLGGGDMARAKTNKNDNLKMKAVMLSAFLVGFIGWRIFGAGVELPSASKAIETVTPQVSKSADDKPMQVVNSSQGFLDKLLSSYRPRLAAYMSGQDKSGATVHQGLIEFYEGSTMAERFTVTQLKALGCAVVTKPYGVDIVTASGTYPVSAWPRPKQDEPKDQLATPEKKPTSEPSA